MRAAHARAVSLRAPERRAGRLPARRARTSTSWGSSRGRRCRTCSARSSSGRRRCRADARRLRAPPDARPSPLQPVLRHGRAATAFVGRDGGVAQLDARLRAGRAAGARRIVLLSGEPGIGKTRLATRVRAGARTATARSSSTGAATRRRCSPTSRSSRRCATTSAAAPPQLLAGQLQLVSGELRRVVPELAARVPGLPRAAVRRPRGRALPALRGGRRAAVRRRRRPAARARARRPALGRRGDAAAAEVRRALPARGAAHGLGTYRETERRAPTIRSAACSPTSRASGASSAWRSRGLDEDAVSELVALHTGERRRRSFAGWSTRRTEGNAFFVVEVLRAPRRGRRRSARGEGRHAASSASRLAAARRRQGRRRPPPRAPGRATRRACSRRPSVLGREFDLDVLERLCDLGEDALARRARARGRAHSCSRSRRRPPGATRSRTR